MSDTNHTSPSGPPASPGEDRSHQYREPPLFIEAATPTNLDYWQSNLREVLDQSSKLVQQWLSNDSNGRLGLEVWGPSSPLLEPLANSDSVHRALMVRFPALPEMDSCFFARIRELGAPRLFLLNRLATTWDRLRSFDSTDPQPSAQDPVEIIRIVHLRLDFRLARRHVFRRRNAAVELAELLPARTEA